MTADRRSDVARLAVGPNLAYLAEFLGDPSAARQVVSAAQLIRTHGHLLAAVNPLPAEFDPPLSPEQRKHLDQLRPERFAEFAGLSPQLVGGPFGADSDDAEQALGRLHRSYTGSTGYEIGHLRDVERREWLENRIESAPAVPLAATAARALVTRLARVEGFERFLQRVFVGEKRFSLEGTEMIVPMLERVTELAYADAFDAVVFGTVSRGRLNLMTQLFDIDAGLLFAEFEHADEGRPVSVGDVKYHRGGETQYRPPAQERGMRLVLLPNPSHLEFVTPVALGVARALQDLDPMDDRRALPVLTHGDAAFAGQGIVAESFNLTQLPGYRTGGTVHILMNNQIGFTTEPRDARSTRYASDLARGFDVPVAHVNADDPEACLRAVELGYEYRMLFGADFLIDLVGYRRRGHQEVDDPAFTQPLMYQAIDAHRTVLDLYSHALVERGVLTEAERDALEPGVADEFRRARENAPHAAAPADLAPSPAAGPTALPIERLRELNAALCTVPVGFSVSDKLERRVLAPKRAFDLVYWGHAEALAWASLLQDGVSVRVTGEDVERGTFAQRHSVWHDIVDGSRFCPVAHVPGASGRFDIVNAPLSETATLAFEYGYSIEAPRAVTVWEAQFGDFANVAQPIIDQFVSAGRFRWGHDSSLVLLLPHGLEGQGAEHSSARPERFLQLCAENNMRVVNCTTAAQYFHLVREHGLTSGPRLPLVVFTPKRLLREKTAASRPAELAEGRFEPVLVRAGAADPAAVTRVLLCTGKIAGELADAVAAGTGPATAIVTVEQLYPVPTAELAQVLSRFPAVQEVAWVQEEPENQGAWPFVRTALAPGLGRHELHYVGRTARVVPAQGSAAFHEFEQHEVLARATAPSWQ